MDVHIHSRGVATGGKKEKMEEENKLKHAPHEVRVALFSWSVAHELLRVSVRRALVV